jgi:3-hydroxyisobutyrate dehydrogenase
MSAAPTPGTGPVGFIGLGNIGAPIAQRLLGRADRLVVFDVRADATEPFVRSGATAAVSPAEVAATAAVICVVVQNEDQVREVLAGPDGILGSAPPGTVVAVHSTISAEGAESFAELAAPSGVEVLDAPVSGGAIGAHEGTLAVMVGGAADAVERARPVFDCFASLVQHMGPVGAGTRTKIARNLITFASFAAAGEAQRLAEAAGLDLAKLGDVVRHSDRVTGGPGAVMLRRTAAVMAADDGLRSIFEHTATLGGKDLELARRLAAELGVDAPFAELASVWLEPALGLVDPPSGTAAGSGRPGASP